MSTGQHRRWDSDAQRWVYPSDPDYEPKASDELGYLHERIDQLVRQAGIEAGLLEIKARAALGNYAQRDNIYELAKSRFWAADDAAAESYGRTPREHD